MLANSFTDNAAEVLAALLVGGVACWVGYHANEISKKSLEHQRREKEEQIFSAYTAGIMELMYEKNNKEASRRETFVETLEKAHFYFIKAYSLALFYKATDLADKIKDDASKIANMRLYISLDDSILRTEMTKLHGDKISSADSDLVMEFLKPEFVNRFRNIIGKNDL